MCKIVLNVGQCRPDTAAITHFLTSHFDVKVVSTDLLPDTMAALEAQQVDLILINRKLDADYSDGMDILQRLKSDERYASIPVMLITNFEEWQDKAIAAGAVRGFGKAELSSPESVDRIRQVLMA